MLLISGSPPVLDMPVSKMGMQTSPVCVCVCVSVSIYLQIRYTAVSLFQKDDLIPAPFPFTRCLQTTARPINPKAAFNEEQMCQGSQLTSSSQRLHLALHVLFPLTN